MPSKPGWRVFISVFAWTVLDANATRAGGNAANDLFLDWGIYQSPSVVMSPQNELTSPQAQRELIRQTKEKFADRFNKEQFANSVYAGTFGGLRGLANELYVLAHPDPWTYYELTYTNEESEHDLLFLTINMPLIPSNGPSEFLGFMHIDLQDSNNDGYVFAGDIPGEPPEGSFPLERVLFSLEGEPVDSHEGNLGENLVTPGLREFAFGPTAGPRAHEADKMHIYLNLTLSAGDTLRVTSGFIQLPLLDDADIDANGFVDGGDLLFWQRELGTSGDDLLADVDGDGRVGASDLAAWRESYAADAAKSRVPEPNGVALLALAGVALARGQRNGKVDS